MSGTSDLEAYLRKTSKNTVGRTVESRERRSAAGTRVPAPNASPPPAGTCSGAYCSKGSMGSTDRRRLAAEQATLSRSFTTPFKTLRERAAVAATLRPPQTSLRLPSSPRLDTIKAVAISAPLEGPILDSRPPATRTAVAHVEEYLRRVKLQPTVEHLPQQQGPARSGGATGATRQQCLATANVAGCASTPKPAPSCELGAFHSRWSGRLRTPGSMQHALAPANRAGLLELEQRPAQAPPTDSSPSWVQPQLFDCATYLDSAMKQHGNLQGESQARVKKRLEFKLPKVPAQLPAGACGLGGTQQVGMVFLRPGSAPRSSPRLALGTGPPNSPPWQAATASLQHQAWLMPPAEEADSASSAAVRPSQAHTGTNPMSPRVEQPVLTSSGACQTSPRLPMDGEEALYGPRRPASPHQAFLPSSPSAEHRCFVRELARPDSRIADGWNLPTGGHHNPSRTSPLQRNPCSPQGPVPGGVAPPAGHTTTHFAAASVMDVDESLSTTGRQWRPMSAGHCYAPGQHPWPSRTSPGVRQQATGMLQVAAANLAHEHPAKSLVTSPNLGPFTAVRQQAAAMTLAASGSMLGLSPTAGHQRYATAADMYLERARRSVAARSVVAPLATSLAMRPPHPACAIPGALASRLQGAAEQVVEPSAWQPDQIASSLARLKRLVSDSSESGGGSPPRSPSSSLSDCSDGRISPQRHFSAAINEEGVPPPAWRVRTGNIGSNLSARARSPSPGALNFRPRAAFDVRATPSRANSSASLGNESPVCGLKKGAGKDSLLSARAPTLMPRFSSQGQNSGRNSSSPDECKLQGGVRASFYSKWLSTVETDCEIPASPGGAIGSNSSV